jgi:hypothetical protein
MSSRFSAIALSSARKKSLGAWLFLILALAIASFAFHPLSSAATLRIDTPAPAQLIV